MLHSETTEENNHYYFGSRSPTTTIRPLTPTMTTAAVFGSTGLVGSHILPALLGLDAVKTVHTISRRAPKADGPKLSAHIEADTSKWAPALAALAPAPDVVLSALGTTRAQAGGVDNQWKIDHDLNIELAKTARAQGVQTFVFISSGATRGVLSGRAPYSRMKQGVEDAVAGLGFEQAVVLRPGFILGAREVPHAGGGLVHAAARALGRVSPGLGDALGQDAAVIARAAVRAALLAREGKAPSKYWVIEGAEIARMGREELRA